MSFNSRKFMNNIKCTIKVITTDKVLQSDFMQVFNKLSQILNLVDYIKLGEKKFGSVHHTVLQIYSSILKIGKARADGKNQRRPLHKVTKIKTLDISNKTNEILESLLLTNTEEKVLQGVETFILHVKQHPEVRNNAVKVGAIRVLLNKRSKVRNEAANCSIREALTILGYTDPVPGRGIRILSIDGGGIRGVLVLVMLKKLEELSGKRIHELFDFICGVSTGAILSYSMGIHFRRLDDIIARYEALSQEVFKQSPIWGTGNLVWSHGYYDTVLWEKKLKEYLGTESLISTSRNSKCPKVCVVSAVVNQSQVSAYVFRNYVLPWRFQSQYSGSYETEVWQAARASAAAPTYFEEFKLGNLIHQDGGILVNNPAAIAVHEAKLLWPNTPIQCVVSFGTGRSVPSPTELLKHNDVSEKGAVATSWTNKFYKILDSATDTEGVHIMLSDLLPENVYYRFNPYLTEMIGMVETDQKKHEQLKRDALMYLRRNEDKFQEAAKTLMLKKTVGQKIMDEINIRREMLGL